MSIANSRSCAWRKPNAKSASCSLDARIVGMPCASRPMRTLFSRPGSASVPSLTGSDERSHNQPDPAPTTSSRTTARTTRRARRAITSDCRLSAEVYDDGLLLREMLEHRLERGFPAEPRLLDAAVGHVGLDHHVLVDLHEPGLEPLGRIERGLEIARPDRRGETVIGIVRLGDRVLVLLELDDAGDRPEYFLAREAVVVAQAGEDHRL